MYISAKKGIVLAVLFISAAAGVYGVAIKKDSASLGEHLVFERASSAAEEADAIARLKAPDSDGDGLRDWEESLWGTDPRNPDSDGDGTPDGTEIKEGRDPSNASANDTRPDPATRSPNYAPEEGEEEILMSDILAWDVSRALATFDEEGASTSTREALAREFLARVKERDGLITKTPPYRKDELRVVPDSRQKIDAYQTALVKTFTAHAKNFGTTEMEIVIQAIESKDSSALEALDAFVSVYRSLAADLAAMDVPQKTAEAHLAIANAYVSLADSVEDLSFAVDDPLRGVVAVFQYQNQRKTIASRLNELFSIIGQ